MPRVGIENVPPVLVDTHEIKKSGNDMQNAGHVKKSAGTVGSAGRKSLQTLQPSGKNRSLLVGFFFRISVWRNIFFVVSWD